MRVNLIIARRGRDAHLPACLHYLNVANAAGRFDVAVYLVDDSPQPARLDPEATPRLQLHYDHRPAPAGALFVKAALLNAGMARMRPGWGWCGIVDVDMLVHPNYFSLITQTIGGGYACLGGDGLSPALTRRALGVLPPFAALLAEPATPFPSPSQVAFTPGWLDLFRRVAGWPTLFDERFIEWGHEDTVPDIAASLLARAGLASKALLDNAWRHLHHDPSPRGAAERRNLALAYRLQQEFRGRLAAYRRGQGSARPALAALDRAAAELAAGRSQPAAAARAALRLEPGSAEAIELLAVALIGLGQLDPAADLLERAAARDPGSPELQLNLGELRRRQGRLDQAADHFQRAIGIYHYFPEAYHNLGLVCRAQGRQEQAAGLFRQAADLRPEYASAHYNLGNTLRDLGQLDAAIAAYRAALAARPDYAEAHANLGAIYQELQRSDPALEHTRRALTLQPGLLSARLNLFRLLERQGRLAEARAAASAALALTPEDDLLRLSVETLQPPIAASAAAIAAQRAALDATIASWSGRALRLDPAGVHQSGAILPFALAYHGVDDRPIKQAYARLFSPCFPAEQPAAAHAGRLRVGFVVTEGHEGVFLKCMGGVIDRLRDPRLQPIVICGRRGGARAIAQFLSNRQVELLPLPERLDLAAAAIRAARLDALYYWEVGSDPLNYFLPFYRLARLQCAGWGWPVTSGIPTIDCYLSSGLLEPEGAEAHYSERLVRLPGLPASYLRPPPPAPVARQALGLGDADHIYLCNQNLRKLHPDFDKLLGQILRRDPRGVVALRADREPAISAALLDRLRAAIPDVAARLRMIPYMDVQVYLGLTAAADVILDSLYFGGVNTCYDALAAHAPTVTLPGQFQRGRWAKALAEAIGVIDGVASSPADYVERALAIGCERGYRAALSARIAAAADELFDRPEPAHELSEFFLTELS